MTVDYAALICRRGQLSRELEQVRAEIRAHLEAKARDRLASLGPQARQVLTTLVGSYHGEAEWCAFPFKSLARRTELTLAQVRRACRTLARLGFAQHEINLWTDDGEMVGAGYRATDLGARYLIKAPNGVRAWLIEVYGFAPHVRRARTKGAARWADYKAAREAGYFVSDFHRYLINCSIREATAAEIARAERGEL